jgi:hypothetical protein
MGLRYVCLSLEGKRFWIRTLFYPDNGENDEEKGKLTTRFLGTIHAECIFKMVLKILTWFEEI